MSCHGFYNRARTQREYRLLKPKEPVNIPLFAVMAHNASIGHRGWMVIVLPQTRTHTIWCGTSFLIHYLHQDSSSSMQSKGHT